MILSGRDLKWYIDCGSLRIDPVKPEQFQQNGIDLVLAHAKHQFKDFYLGCTAETLELPNDLMAFVELRSTWARLGFMLPPTIVDAGFRGNLTLEIVRFGVELLPVGQRFIHLIFAKLTSPTELYRGKYDQQSGVTGAKLD
jgi:dCTP deaminase